MKKQTYQNPKLIKIDSENNFVIETDVKNKFDENKSNILGSTALVAGTTVGAGILALPAVTLPAGIVPSTTLLMGVWLYALISALLIAELVVNRMHSATTNIGFIAIVETYLGQTGGRVAGIAYLFLHYALLVAYLAEGGEILTETIFALLSNLTDVSNYLPRWSGNVIFAAVMGSILYLGKDKFVERINSIFVGVVILSFMGLLILTGEQVQLSNFVYQNWKALPTAIPIMLVALFYHNIVPVVVTQLKGDVKKIRQSIAIGSAIPLIMFIAWNIVILGSVGHADISNIDPLETLRSGSFGKLLGILISIFSEFAIATSFIGFIYGLLDFFKDLHFLKNLNLLSSNNKSNSVNNSRLSLLSLALIPPTGLSVLNPDIFLSALDYAGTYSTSILSGILPALMIWKQREEYKSQSELNQGDISKSPQKLVPGGRLTLVLISAIALWVILHQLLKTL